MMLGKIFLLLLLGAFVGVLFLILAVLGVFGQGGE